MDALENAKVPVYRHSIIRVYFWDQMVLAQTASDIIRKEMTRDVPQGSVLVPLLWNIAFEDILKEDISLRVSIICYADDTLVVTAEGDIPMIDWKVNTILKGTRVVLKVSHNTL